MGDNVYPKEKKTENNCKMMWRVLSLVSIPGMYVFPVTGTLWVKMLIHVCCGLQTDESLFPIFFIKFIKFLINFDFRITQIPCIIIMKVLLLILFFVLCMCILLAYMSVHHLHAWRLQRPEKGIRSPDTGAAARGELPCACWDSIMGSLEEQPVLSATHWASWASPNHPEHGNDFRAFRKFSITQPGPAERHYGTKHTISLKSNHLHQLCSLVPVFMHM